MDAGVTAEGKRVADASVDAREASIEDAYRRLRDPIYRYVRRFATSDEDAADLTARTFERALTKLSTFRGGRDELPAWLFRIARSQAVDATRRRHPARPLDLVAPERLPHSLEGLPERETLIREQGRELAEHVKSLPPLQQECLALRYGAGLTTREIATVIGKGEAATQKLISRALARLKERYE